jgi:hypothetical protein
MNDLESHTRIVISGGLAVTQRVVVERVVTEDALIKSIESRGQRAGTTFPYHPEAQIFCGKKKGPTCRAVIALPPRVDRASIDTREVTSWPSRDDKFIIAVPSRLLFLKFTHGRFDSGRCYFLKSRPNPMPAGGYDPELYYCLLPNQYLDGRMCTGSVFRDIVVTEPQHMLQAALVLFNESAYNNHFHQLFTWTDSPFSGSIPDGFEVPDMWKDAEVFKTLPTGDYARVDGNGNRMEKGEVMLWHFCRWQAWTEAHLMSWQRDIDDLVRGDACGTLCSVWGDF